MSVSEFARHRGVAARVVNAAVAAGRIEREADGSIDVTQADYDWERNTRKIRRDPTVDAKAGLKRRETWAKKLAARATAVAAQQPQPSTADQEPESYSVVADVVADYGKLESNSMSYADARAYKENLAAKLMQIELARRQGSVLPREAVAQAIETLFRVHRDAVLNIPNRIAALVFEQTSVADVQALLEAELRASLEELSTTLARMANQRTSTNPRPARSNSPTV